MVGLRKEKRRKERVIDYYLFQPDSAVDGSCGLDRRRYGRGKDHPNPKDQDGFTYQNHYTREHGRNNS
jgi:hypothetical protein